MTGRARVVALLVAGVLAGLLAGCSGSGGASSPHPGTSVSAQRAGTTSAPARALTRFYEQKLDWHGCSGGFECARLLVPIDYAHPRRGTLRIAVNRLPASGDRLGSLLVNPGGPGVSGLQYARAARSIVSAPVRERYDVVGFDPRGVGASRPIECLTDKQLDRFIAYDGTPDTPAEEQGLSRQGRILGQGCQQDDAALLPHLSTEDAARDMDVLRAALGDRKLTYLGKSYGTFLGATYAGLFPKRVGRLVLDGPLDPAADSMEAARMQAIGFQRALNAFLDDCLRRSSCPVSGTRADAQQRLQELIDGLDATPLPGEGARVLTQSLGTYGLAVALYDKGNWQFLRQALSQAFKGDGSSLLMLADFYTDRGPGGHYTTNTNEAIYAVNCLDRPVQEDLAQFRSDAADVATVSPLFGGFIVWSNLPCTTWPSPATGKPGAITAAGSKPILVVGTTRDPATPYEQAKALASELKAGHLLTYVGDGHTAYRRGSRCIDAAVDAYLLRGTVPADGTRCH